MTTPATSQDQHVDIAIIGGGVAGSSAAIVLQNAGWRTAVVEREPVFRDRVRGDACHPWGVRELIELDLKKYVDDMGGVELPLWTRYENRQPQEPLEWAAAFPGSPPEIGFNHPELQERLLQAAEEAGARVFRPARANVARMRDGWTLSIEREETSIPLTADFLIAADGKNSATRKMWGSESWHDDPHHSFSGMLVTGLDLPENSAHQGFYESGFSMIFPQGQDRWRVYYVGPSDDVHTFSGKERIPVFLEACAACFPEGAFENAREAGPLALFPNAHMGCTRIDGPRAIAIGDAAGAGDPSQGHGMSLVWRDVRVLRDLLATTALIDVPAAFAEQRRAYEHVLRTHAVWVSPLTTRTDDEAMALKAQVEKARAEDPTALGYAAIFAMGPDGLPTDDNARARFFGEHLSQDPIVFRPKLDKFG